MIKVRIYSSFCEGSHCCQVFEKLLRPLNIDYNDKIEFVNDDSYTHAIILNNAMPILKCPKENVLGLAFEPNNFLGLTQEFIKYVYNNVGKYHIGTCENGLLKYPFVEQHSFMWHSQLPINILPKNNKMSIIFSQKSFAPGHKYRIELVKEILKQNLDIDIYGRGCKFLRNINDKRIKGEFKENEPYDGYMYSIAIENYSLSGYYSEKYLNCLMYETIPIYWGCPNVEKEYPNHNIFLTGELNKDIILLKHILINPNKYKKTIDRYKVLEKHNIINYLLELWK